MVEAENAELCQCAKRKVVVQYAVVGKGEMRISNIAGERVIVAVVKLVSLRCHSGMTHYDISVLAEFQVNIVSGKRALENREFATGVIREACGISSALLAFLR